LDTGWIIWGLIPSKGKGIFSSQNMPILGLGHTQLPIQWALEFFCWGKAAVM
jgi:hypothetical protein